MTDSQRRPTLQAILALDSATCVVMGILLISVPGPVEKLTGIPEPLLFWAGVVLLPIAALMAIFARATMVPSWATQIIVTGNVLWALASVILPLAGLISPNGLGWLFLLMQAAVVVLFAGLELTAGQRAPVVA